MKVQSITKMGKSTVYNSLPKQKDHPKVVPLLATCCG